MQTNQLMAIKLNYCLEKMTQQFTQYKATVFVSSDERTLVITNNKPIENVFQWDESSCSDSSEDINDEKI